MPEQQPSQEAVYTATPTVRIDGQEDQKLSALIIAVEMREAEGGLSALEMRLSNVASDPEGDSSFAFDDDASIGFGKTITVYGGDENAPQEIFRGVITGLEADFPEEGPPEMVVFAEDALQQARMTRRSREFRDITIQDLANELASEMSLTPVVTAFRETVGTWLQLNESNLAFLRRVLDRYDGDVQVVEDELHVSPRGEVRRGEIELELHSQLRSARVCADLAHQVTEVTISGFNVEQGERVTATSTGASLLPGTGRSGSQILRQSIGERSEHIGHLAVPTREEAQALADSDFDRRARRFIVLEGKAEGNPALRVGTHINVSGLGQRFDNTYYVVKACHRFDVFEGYSTDFEAECAFTGA